MSMNRCVLVGRLTKEVELRYTPNGIAVATFTLAVNRTFSNGNGEKEADFINCVVWRKPAENVSNFTKKGSLVGVDGRLQSRSYEGTDGKRVYVTEVVCDSVQFLEYKKEDNQQQQQPQSFSTPGAQQRQQSNFSNNQPARANFQGNSFADYGQPIDISDQDLPF